MHYEFKEDSRAKTAVITTDENCYEIYFVKSGDLQNIMIKKYNYMGNNLTERIDIGSGQPKNKEYLIPELGISINKETDFDSFKNLAKQKIDASFQSKEFCQYKLKIAVSMIQKNYANLRINKFIFGLPEIYYKAMCELDLIDERLKTEPLSFDNHLIEKINKGDDTYSIFSGNKLLLIAANNKIVSAYDERFSVDMAPNKTFEFKGMSYPASIEGLKLLKVVHYEDLKEKGSIENAVKTNFVINNKINKPKI